MNGYPYLLELFTNVLQKSKAIAGRIHYSPKYGLEINTDQLGEVLTDLVDPKRGNKYPMVLMMPPRGRGGFTDRNGEWEKIQVSLFFLTASFYNGANQVKAKNPNTNTSTHQVFQDWHDMKRSALNFIRVVDKVQKLRSLTNNVFRLDQADRLITPVSFIGADRAAGVRLDFAVSLFSGCTLEDYNEGDIANISVPEGDSHPEHNQ